MLQSKNNQRGDIATFTLVFVIWQMLAIGALSYTAERIHEDVKEGAQTCEDVQILFLESDKRIPLTESDREWLRKSNLNRLQLEQLDGFLDIK